MLIRGAAPADAAAECEVLRASRSDLCVAYHGNDPRILGRWLSDKTPENVAAWTEDAGHSTLVAIEGRGIVAAGSVCDSGGITMSYVAPGARFHGIRTVLLAAKRERPHAVASTALRHLEIEIRPHRHMV